MSRKFFYLLDDKNLSSFFSSSLDIMSEKNKTEYFFKFDLTVFANARQIKMLSIGHNMFLGDKTWCTMRI